MCTVTYVPIKEGFFLTSNRDESIKRAAVEWPCLKKFPGYNLLYPRDLKGNGTWIAADDKNRVICLLNGAFKPHIRKKNYRISRGLVVLDLFEYSSIDEFQEAYNLNDIEPFTLVIFWDQELMEFRWDGVRKHRKRISDTKPYIWSSVTLYNPEMTVSREAWFKQWLEKPGKIDRNKVISFHTSENTDNAEINIKMKRANVQTLSITSVMSIGGNISAVYNDLTTGIISKSILKGRNMI